MLNSLFTFDYSITLLQSIKHPCEEMNIEVVIDFWFNVRSFLFRGCFLFIMNQFVKVYLKHSTPLLKSDRKSFVYLSYLKLQLIAPLRGGRFTLENFMAVTGLSKISAKKHLTSMVQYKWIKINYSNKTYQLISNTKLFESYRRDRYVKLDINTLLSFNWRNISYFRALLTEFAIEEADRKKQVIIRGYTRRDSRGKKEKIQNRTLKEFDFLVALSYVSKIIGKSETTVHNYRAKQTISVYKSKLRVFSLDVLYKNPNILNTNKGKYFQHNDKLYFQTTSRRFKLSKNTI